MNAMPQIIVCSYQGKMLQIWRSIICLILYIILSSINVDTFHYNAVDQNLGGLKNVLKKRTASRDTSHSFCNPRTESKHEHRLLVPSNDRCCHRSEPENNDNIQGEIILRIDMHADQQEHGVATQAHERQSLPQGKRWPPSCSNIIACGLWDA